MSIRQRSTECRADDRSQKPQRVLPPEDSQAFPFESDHIVAGKAEDLLGSGCVLCSLYLADSASRCRFPAD